MTNKIRNKVVDDGARRQRLHENQDNRGTKKNPPEYENLKGEPLK